MKKSNVTSRVQRGLFEAVQNELCHRIKGALQKDIMAVHDDTAAIGKLYRRRQEIGTHWCVTVDVDSREDGAVTVRDRDTMTQERVPEATEPADPARGLT